MVNINGKEWNKLEPSDIKAILENVDIDESFYYEFKDDKVSPKKLMEEVSALANTFGGYIFLGITNIKQIEGCREWNEQRIHTTIHDSITPTPSFDVKRFTFDTDVIYVIKIDEGSEPPYITSSGKIYERLSSGSFPIKDSSKLSQIYSKREQLLSKMEKKISISPVQNVSNNIYGYIDSGFCLVTSDSQATYDIFRNANLKAIAKELAKDSDSFNLSFVGNSVIYTPGGLSSPNRHLPAHTNNFLEIMPDGSARMRILLINNNQEDSHVNMVLPMTILKLYKELYKKMMGALFPEKMIYAKKYESLTVLSQFQPTLFHEDYILKQHPHLEEDNKRLLCIQKKHQEIYGVATVVTDDRIPKTGLYTIDKRNMELWGEEYSAESIVDELFYSRFIALGTVRDDEEEN